MCQVRKIQRIKFSHEEGASCRQTKKNKWVLTNFYSFVFLSCQFTSHFSHWTENQDETKNKTKWSSNIYVKVRYLYLYFSSFLFAYQMKFMGFVVLHFGGFANSGDNVRREFKRENEGNKRELKYRLVSIYQPKYETFPGIAETYQYRLVQRCFYTGFHDGTTNEYRLVRYEIDNLGS